MFHGGLFFRLDIFLLLPFGFFNGGRYRLGEREFTAVHTGLEGIHFLFYVKDGLEDGLAFIGIESASLGLAGRPGVIEHGDWLSFLKRHKRLKFRGR